MFSQQGRARKRNTPTSLPSSPPISCWASPIAEPNRKSGGKRVYSWVHKGHQHRAGQRVGLESQTEDMEDSCGDVRLQKCCPPVQEGAAAWSLWPPHATQGRCILVCVGRGGCRGGRGDMSCLSARLLFSSYHSSDFSGSRVAILLLRKSDQIL